MSLNVAGESSNKKDEADARERHTFCLRKNPATPRRRLSLALDVKETSMALQLLQPFTQQEYLNQIDQTIHQIVDSLLLHEPRGWLSVLDRYQFRGMNRAEGERIREHYHREMRNAETSEDRLKVANQVLAWGGMQPIQGTLANRVLTTLTALDSEETLQLSMIEGSRIASLSKIYEMWSPQNWIIFDSYCAIGLQWLVAQVWTVNGEETLAGQLRFPWPPGRVNQPLVGFPRCSTSRQAAIAFVYSSWLSRKIAELLNRSQSQQQWQAYQVEMVLFQLGHEIDA